MKLKGVLEEREDGGYTVFVPSLPGCISEGDTREEATLSHIQKQARISNEESLDLL